MHFLQLLKSYCKLSFLTFIWLVFIIIINDYVICELTFNKSVHLGK